MPGGRLLTVRCRWLGVAAALWLTGGLCLAAQSTGPVLQALEDPPPAGAVDLSGSSPLPLPEEEPVPPPEGLSPVTDPTVTAPRSQPSRPAAVPGQAPAPVSPSFAPRTRPAGFPRAVSGGLDLPGPLSDSPPLIGLPPPPVFPSDLGVPPALPPLHILGWDQEGGDGFDAGQAEPGPAQALLEGDDIQYRKSAGDIRAEGDARFQYRALSLSAPLLYVHESRELVHAQGGGARLFFQGHQLDADRLFVDFRKKEMKARGAVRVVRRASTPKKDAGEEDDEEALLRALKKRATTLTAQDLDVTWEKGQGTLSASGDVLVEQPKWTLQSKVMRIDEQEETMMAVGDVVWRLSDSRWLIEEEVLPATKLSRALQDDPLTVTTPRLDYDYHNQIGSLKGPVVMTQPQKRLTATALTFNDRDQQVFFETFHYEQDDSQWLLDKGVVGSVPKPVQREMDQRLTAASRKAMMDRGRRRFRMEGGVLVRQGTQRVSCDVLVYDEDTRRLELLGNAEVLDETTQEFLRGEHLVYNEQTGRFEAAGLVRIKVKLDEEEVP